MAEYIVRYRDFTDSVSAAKEMAIDASSRYGAVKLFLVKEGLAQFEWQDSRTDSAKFPGWSLISVIPAKVSSD
jgi:hypothetical protein